VQQTLGCDEILGWVRLEEFDYELPAERIAQVPVEPRDAARLLVDRGSDPPEHRTVADLPALLRPGDVVVVNDTKVIPARLRLYRVTGGAAEVLLLEPRDPARRRWEALVRPARRLGEGEHLHSADGRAVLVVGPRTPAGDTFLVELTDEARLDELGEMPLPPYIHERLDRPDRYQTVYAREPGSAAAPTAGLHLTPQLMDRIRAVGVAIHAVELAVGLDTFQPITEADPLDHPMHTERYRVPDATWAACREATRVVAVGTTTVRALESTAATGRREGRTDLFLHRGSPFRVVDVLLTNFHLPRTTLLMMIDAFVGPRWRDLYATALADGYRFLSFGDAMLLDRHAG
jgi:S-adenosylmethionine:tRNA ribosyltransferase-isomerase